MPMKPPDFFREIQRNLPQIEREIAATVVVVEAENHFAGSFRNEGFTDRSLQPWPARKKTEPGSKRGLLIGKGTGTLRRQATKGQVIGNRVSFTIGVPYGKVHNEGLRAGRGAGFQMPKRQFIGDSQVLNERIERKIKAFLNNKFKR